MKKNGKRYTVLLGTLLTALAICACGGDIGRGTGGDSENGAETTSASRGMGKLLEDADITADGLTMLVNTVMVKDADAETDDLEQYLVDCARKLDETDIYELCSVTQDTTLTEKFSYPVYIVEFTTGANEDTVKWTVFAMDTDQYTYLYGVCTDMDAAEDMDGITQDIFGGLYLTDEVA